MSKRVSAAVLALVAASVPDSWAGITVYEEGDKKIEIGGLIQLQYVSIDPDCSGSPCIIDAGLAASDDVVDEVFFRRLRPYVQGSVTKDWAGKIEFDFGEAESGDELKVKDAYFVFSGFKNDALELTIGNAKPGFSREFMTSSSKQQLVERSFVGDHNFGVPDRSLGLKLDGAVREKKITWTVAAGGQNHDPSAVRMDFDTPINRETDWNEGWLAAGRVDFHPLGHMKFDQADFRSKEWKLTVGASAFAWANDDDNNTYTGAGGAIICSDPNPNNCKADLDSASGVEISGGLRGHGLSVDVQYNVISGDTVDPAFTGGIYSNGSTDLDEAAIEAGYMLGRLEVVAGWSTIDADNYQDTFERTSVGVNVYFNKHNVKASLDYQWTDNFLGLAGQDHNVILAQSQFQF